MRSRWGAVTVIVAASMMGVAQVALVDGCASFSVVEDAKEASVASADAPPGDLDASPSDAPAADAANAPDAAATDAGCGHTFCADFEEPQPAAGWAGGDQLGVGGAVAIAIAAGASGNALRSTIPASTAAVQDWAYVVQPFAGAAGIHLELEINAPVAPLDAQAVLTLVQFSGQVAMKESGVGVVLRSSGLGFYLPTGDGSATSPPAQLDLPRGKWVHVVLDMRFGAGGTMKLVVDGQTAWDSPLGAQLPPMPELRIGVQHYNGGTPAFAALYDTVRLDVIQ